MPISVCYLCGKKIAARSSSRDHAVPKQLLEGQPPKVRGFDYAGVLPTHKKCNNEFGPESYGQRALELLAVLHDPACTKTYRHLDDSAIRLMALNSSCLPNFTSRELKYFKIIDRRTHGAKPTPAASTFRSAQAVDPFSDALYTALAVLLKSAAALVVQRKLRSVPDHWQVLAVPYVGAADSIDFDDLFGTTKPFGKKVKVWLGRLVTDDILVVYRAGAVVVYFLFRFSATMEGWRRMRNRCIGATRLRFDGTSINEILRSGWKRV
jgi:hypothetical protein